MAYLERELGVPAVSVMKAIKEALDPLGLLNPGKMLPNVSKTP
jgi:FAD/FMN-containing dehydrogenase